MLQRMQADLLAARKARDEAAITALRTVMGAIANAQAPSADGVPTDVYDRIEQHQRLVLDSADVDAIIRAEIADRDNTIAQIVGHGRDDAANDLRAEIAVLARFVEL